MLDGHLLLAFGPVAGERLHLHGECPHEFVRLIAGAVLLLLKVSYV